MDDLPRPPTAGELDTLLALSASVLYMQLEDMKELLCRRRSPSIFRTAPLTSSASETSPENTEAS